MEKPKNKIPRGPAATAAKNKYRDKNYDRIELAIPKGMKQTIRDHIENTGDRSVNAFATRAFLETMSRDNGENQNEQAE